MSATLIADVQDQAQAVWAPIMVDELVESAVVPSVVNTDYDGQIKQLNDTVYISMLRHANASKKTVGAGHDVFDSEKMVTVRTPLVADTVITASFEIDSLIDLQTQLGNPDGKSKIRQALVKGLELKLNEHIYSLVAPSTSNPDHLINGVTDFNAGQLLAVRKLAAQAKWMRDGNWYAVLDPSYMNDLMSSTQLASLDFVNDQPTIGGQFAGARYGFKIMEDNSDAMSALSPTAASEDYGLFFHKDFLYLAMQQEPTFEISSLHALKQHGYLVSVKMILGATLGIEGDKKHVVVYNV